VLAATPLVPTAPAGVARRLLATVTSLSLIAACTESPLKNGYWHIDVASVSGSVCQRGCEGSDQLVGGATLDNVSIYLGEVTRAGAGDFELQPQGDEGGFTSTWATACGLEEGSSHCVVDLSGTLSGQAGSDRRTAMVTREVSQAQRDGCDEPLAEYVDCELSTEETWTWDTGSPRY